MIQTGRKIHITWYVLSDYLSGVTSWIILYFTRRLLLNEAIFVDGTLFLNNRFWIGLILIPAGWIFFYALTGTYHSLYKKSRLTEFTNTALTSLIGCTVLFFAIVINDPQTDYRYYYKAYFTFLLMHFLITWIGRWVILTITKMQLRKGPSYSTACCWVRVLLGRKSMRKRLTDCGRMDTGISVMYNRITTCPLICRCQFPDWVRQRT